MSETITKPRYFIGAALYGLVPVLVILYFAHHFASERDRLEAELAQCQESHNATPTQHETATDAENSKETDT